MPFKKRSEMSPEEIEADKLRRSRGAQKRAYRRAARKETAPAILHVEPEETQEAEEADDHFLDDLLSDAEIAALYAEAAKKVAAERKKARATVIYEKALYEERRKAGLVGVAEAERHRLDEMVWITVDLPRFKNQRDVPFLRIDGQGFYHGRSYQVTVAQAQSMNEMMWRMKAHVAQFYGESRTYFDPKQARSVYMGGAAAGGALMGAGA